MLVLVVPLVWVGVWTYPDLRYRQGESACDKRCEEDGEVHVVDFGVFKRMYEGERMEVR